MKRKRAFVLLAAGAFLLLASPAFAQRTTANIYGLVMDSSGAVIPGATVLLTNEATGIEHRAVSNEVGEFSATFLPVGRYTLKIEAAGFKTYVQKGIEMVSSQQSRLPITLEVGAAAEEVQVTAEAPLVQNATAQLNDSVTRAQMDLLPAVNRDFAKLLTLQNGVTQATTGSGMFTINGLATAGISITVDGVDAAGNAETPLLTMFGSRNLINVVSQEAIEEVNVSKGVISAEVGRTLSGNVNVITKGGTNKFHGSLFENWRNDVLNARYALLAPTDRKPVVRFHQFGGSFGGPIVKDKAFFFFAYEGYRQNNTTVQTGLVPTPEFKAKAAAAVPAYKAILDLWPAPTDTYNAATAVSALCIRTEPDVARDNHIVLRGDYGISSVNRISGRYTRGRPYGKSPSLVSANPTDFTYTSDSGNLSWVHSAPTWTSETRGGLNNGNTTRAERAFYTGLPAIEIQSHFALGAEEMLLIGHTYSMEQIFAKTKGRHTIKVGGAYNVQTPGRRDEEIPRFRYSNATTFLANTPNRVRLTFGVPLFHGRSWQLSGFVQDDFRIRSNLVLNLGIRYEYYSVYKVKEDTILNAGTPENVYAIPIKYRPSDSIYNGDFNNFLPRVGIAWSPGKGGMTTVRGGFGVGVAQLDLRHFYNFTAYSPNLIYRYDFTGSDITSRNLKYPITNKEAAVWVQNTTVPVGPRTWYEDNPMPLAFQWTMDVQRQLTPTTAVQLGYVGTRGHHLMLSHRRNQQDRLTGARPYPHILDFNFKNADEFSKYHGLQFAFRKRFSQNLMFNVNYTWSKVLALNEGDFAGSGDDSVQDENNILADYGRIGSDRAHVFVSNFAYTLPLNSWLNAKGALKEALGGWGLGGIVRASTGYPITVTQSTSFSSRTRADYILGSNPYTDGSNKFLYLNAAAFSRVPLSAANLPVRGGTSGRGAYTGPGAWTVDLSLAKSVSLGESRSLSFRADMFNAFNHVNLSNPTMDVTSALFGRITTVDAPRSMQLALRFVF